MNTMDGYRLDRYPLDSYRLHLAARRARAAEQGVMLRRLAAATRRGWARLWTTCKRRLRLREIAEA